MDLFLKVFAKPVDEQEEEIFFYSMMFLVIAAGSGITMFLMVSNTHLILVVIRILSYYCHFLTSLFNITMSYYATSTSKWLLVAGGRRAMRSGPSNFFYSKLGDRFIPGTVVRGRTIDRTAIHHQ